ncbi:hypothetical protein EVAR_101758_1 [Eumeta japonica]|uniref:Uncharacterized protein n=1 Tax=Eumeta variegata TaxID=151549 RepID=A0A4C1SQ60_EUMVA|nr:hypothetical protein EVAR_101758_1 [Eumeta japonica]
MVDPALIITPSENTYVNKNGINKLSHLFDEVFFAVGEDQSAARQGTPRDTTFYSVRARDNNGRGIVYRTLAAGRGSARPVVLNNI